MMKYLAAVLLAIVEKHVSKRASVGVNMYGLKLLKLYGHL